MTINPIYKDLPTSFNIPPPLPWRKNNPIQLPNPFHPPSATQLILGNPMSFNTVPMVTKQELIHNKAEYLNKNVNEVKRTIFLILQPEIR